MSPEPETPARAEQVDLTFFVEGEEEALPATLYVGDGYSLYIPDEDWDGPEQSTESGVPTDTWVSAFNSDVALSVSRYGDMTVTEARDAFAQSSGYEFEDLMGGSPDDPLTGTNEKGEYLSFFVAAGGGADSYAVSWRYPAEAAEGFGARLIDVNVTDVWDEKIFDPLPLAAEHTAQICDRVAVFGADQRKNFSCHRFCRAIL